MLPLRRAKSTTSNYNCHQGAASYSSNFNFRHLQKKKDSKPKLEPNLCRIECYFGSQKRTATSEGVDNFKLLTTDPSCKNMQCSDLTILLFEEDLKGPVYSCLAARQCCQVRSEQAPSKTVHRPCCTAMALFQRSREVGEQVTGSGGSLEKLTLF